jgi:hypothetical protein
MKLSLSVSKKLRTLLKGEEIPYSQLKSPTVNTMLEDGIIDFKLKGRSRKTLFIPNTEQFLSYLKNQMGINNLNAYIELSENTSTRADSVRAASDAKISTTRTFKGFLVNSLHPVMATINDKQIDINPLEGSFVFISDYETFRIPKETTIVGIENGENFRFLQQQAYLFPDPNTLFVSRYPQSGDLINWLKQLPNPYIHFGDYDFAGIRIFLNEFHKHLDKRAKLFIPDNLENLFAEFGNRKLYEKQLHLAHDNEMQSIKEITSLMHKYKKSLEQEVFIEK